MRLCYALSLSLLAGFPRIAHAQQANPEAAAAVSDGTPTGDVDAARLHFKNGVDSYRDGDLANALIEFKRAYAAAENYRLLFNLGQVCDELRDYTEAERYFREYLRQGGDEIDAARLREVQATLLKVTGRIASLELTANVAGATFYVDDVPVGNAPLRDAVRVSAGRRRISATAPGYSRVSQWLDAAGGETLVLHLELPLSVADARTSAAATAASGTEEKHGNPAVLWLGIGSGVLAVSTAVMGYLAYQDSAAYQSALDRKTTRAELDDLASQAQTKALVTDVLLGATVVATGLTIYLAVKNNGERQPEQRSAQLRIAPGALSVRGWF
jgi:tetratricopeptide (TPR) repeat protein